MRRSLYVMDDDYRYSMLYGNFVTLTNLSVEDWRRIAGEDTGSMFVICAVLGARSERLRQYGHLVGVLYHGCDDVGDQRGLELQPAGGPALCSA